MDAHITPLRTKRTRRNRRTKIKAVRKQLEKLLVGQSNATSNGGATKHNADVVVNAPGVITDLGVTNTDQACVSLSEQGKVWLQRYIDPAGVHHAGSGGRRVPDGTLPFSAAPEYRYLQTLYRPNQDIAVTDTTGSNGSWLILTVPLLRAMNIVLFNSKSRDFEGRTMVRFCRAWANSQASEDRGLVTFPNWVQYDQSEEDGESYFTVCAATALSNLLPPDGAGNSPVISQFRVASLGYTLQHNTPTLFDQATAVVGRFNTNASERTVKSEGVPGFTGAYIQVTVITNPPPQSANFAVRVASDGQSVANLAGLGLPNIPIPPGGSINLPFGGLPLTADIRNGSASFRFEIGDELRYELRDGAFGGLFLVNVDKGTELFLNPGFGQTSTRIYYRTVEDLGEDDITVIEEIPSKVIVIGLPPTSQPDIMQSNPDAYQALMKDHGGYYAPSQIFEPVFNMTPANRYGKIVFTVPGYDVAEADDLTLGWFDSLDSNFSTTVASLSTVPYAAAPFMKIMRCDEYVPSSGSLLGPFAVQCGPDDPIIRQAAYDMANKLPHAFPVNFNGIGLLFAKVCAVLQRIRLAAANVHNISTKVCDVVDAVCNATNMEGYEKRDTRMVY